MNFSSIWGKVKRAASTAVVAIGAGVGAAKEALKNVKVEPTKPDPDFKEVVPWDRMTEAEKNVVREEIKNRK